MYSHDDLVKTYSELKEKIAASEITDEVFAEVEAELQKLAEKQPVVKCQIVALVKEANEMCELHKQVQGHANALYAELKRKQLEGRGIDLAKQENMNKYDSYLSHQLTYGDFLKVELHRTMS